MNGLNLDGYNLLEGFDTLNGIYTWIIISIVLALVGGVVIYFLFIRSNKKFEGFLKKLHEFLSFKMLLIEEILKVTYVVAAIYLTLSSFGYISISFVWFLYVLVLGNIALRAGYELCMLLVRICQNTSEINSKLKK